MAETFIERRKKYIAELLELYGGNVNEADVYVGIWIKQRLTQKEIEMILAADHGATSQELAEQFGFSTRSHARGALTRATDKAGLPRHAGDVADHVKSSPRPDVIPPQMRRGS